MAKYDFCASSIPSLADSSVVKALTAIANELADWNELSRKMYELNKQQVEREETAKAVGTPKPVSDKDLKDQENYRFFMERIQNKRFVVRAPILGHVVGKPDQGIVPNHFLVGGIFNAALNKIRFELFSSMDFCGRYIGVVDIPTDQVRRDLCEGKLVTVTD